ncbi:MAG: hypothetical protein ACM3SX_14100 [Deltaproteobacteria bacterium]
MTRGSLLRAIAISAVALVAGGSARAQTLCTTSGVTLKSFTPLDSLFLNPTATSFTIKLFNSVSGCPTEYRVSHFSDFHDASWTAYSTTPSTVIQRTWFPAITSSTTKITLYFQVRVKNPQGGFPTNISGGTQPMYYYSSILGHSIRLEFFG